MYRRKFIVIRSTISHILGHKLIFGILLLMMALVFLVQIIFSGFVISFNNNRYARVMWDESVFFSTNIQLDSGEVDTVLEELFPYRDHIRDVYISGVVPEEYYAEQETASGNSWVLSVIAFYPNVSPDRLGDNSVELCFDNEDVIYLDGLLSGIVLSPETPPTKPSEELSDTITPTPPEDQGTFEMANVSYRINGKLWKSQGSIDLKHPVHSNADAYIVSSYDRFFELTDHCTSVNIQFDQPLGETELLRLNQRLRDVGLSNVEFTSYRHELGAESVVSFFVEYTAIVTVILLLAVNVLSLFDYLLSLRKTEFQVYLLSGGTLKTIWKCALTELLICVVLAAVIGGSLVLLPFSRILIPEDIWRNFARFFVGNVLAFLGIILIGFIIRMKLMRLEKKFLFSERGSK